MRSIPFRSPSVGSPNGDLVAISLPSGEASSIVIDNPSGSWLSVFPLHDFVPPYTLQWSRDFPYSIASATVRYTAGPADQPSTLEGDPITAWLDSERVGASEGVSAPGANFRPLTTPTLDVVVQAQHLNSFAIQTNSLILAASVVGLRVRIYGFHIWYSFDTDGSGNAPNMDAPVRWGLHANPVAGGIDLLAGGVLWHEHPHDFVEYGAQPRDVVNASISPAQGLGVDLKMRTRWAGTNVGYHLRYALV